MTKNYILDTNILIEDPTAIYTLRNGTENNIYIPYHVLMELDELKKTRDLGPIANYAISLIEKESDWINIINGKTSHSKLTKNYDSFILDEVKFLDVEDPILVTNDKLARIRAKEENINSQEFHDSNPYKSESQIYTGFSNDLDNIIKNSFTLEKGKPVFHGKEEKVIDYEHNVWNINPKDIYQNLAFELLLNEDLDLITIQSEAGKGKTTLALAAALYLIFQKKSQKKLVVTKLPTEEYTMGHLPGDLDEKFAPSIRPIRDLIMKLHHKRNITKKAFKDEDDKTEDFKKNFIELLPFNYIQGLNIENSILIIDEAQNLTRRQMRTILTRCSENTRVFAIGDTRQVQNPYTNEENNGLNWIVKLCKGEKNFGHIVLSGKKSRGPVTDLVLKTGL